MVWMVLTHHRAMLLHLLPASPLPDPPRLQSLRKPHSTASCLLLRSETVSRLLKRPAQAPFLHLAVHRMRRALEPDPRTLVKVLGYLRACLGILCKASTWQRSCVSLIQCVSCCANPAVAERRAGDVNELHAALDVSYANAPQQIDAEP